MIAKCIDGPCAGEEHPLPDDVMIGHHIMRALPYDDYDPNAPVPLDPYKVSALLTQRFATYTYTGDGLMYVPD